MTQNATIPRAIGTELIAALFAAIVRTVPTAMEFATLHATSLHVAMMAVTVYPVLSTAVSLNVVMVLASLDAMSPRVPLTMATVQLHPHPQPIPQDDAKSSNKPISGAAVQLLIQSAKENGRPSTGACRGRPAPAP